MNSVRDIFNSRLRAAVKESTTLVRDYAQNNHDYSARSGDLEKSVETQFSVLGLTGEVYLDTNIASYGPFVHEGTPAHMIFPQNKRALRWFIGPDEAVFAKGVNHPGYKGDPFLHNALKDNKTQIDEIFAKHTEKAVNDVASTLRDGIYSAGR